MGLGIGWGGGVVQNCISWGVAPGEYSLYSNDRDDRRIF